MHEYDLIADWYARDRTHPTGIPELEALVKALPAGASVLDVGCGNGVPLTKLLVDAGFDVLGVDSSSRMVEKFRANLPGVPVVCERIQSVDLEGRTFDAAISWGMIFHLTPSEQAAAFARVAAALEPGGRFLFTAGDKDGGDGFIEGQMDGVTFRYYSLDVDGYCALLREHGLELLETHADAGENTYYLARKI